MGRPCQVCAHLERADIDRLLSRHVVNVAEVARLYKLGEQACRRHRNEHLPDFLPAFQGQADAPTLSKLQAEYQRLYMVACDELARAQAGALVDVGKDGREVRTVSSTAVARAVDNARKALDGVVRLSADAGDPDEAPSGVATGELMARIQRQIERVEGQRELTVDTPLHTDAPVDAYLSTPLHTHALPSAEVPQHQAQADSSPPGGQGGDPGAPRPSQIPLDSATPSKTLNLPLTVRRVLEQDAASKESSTLRSSANDQVVAKVPHPRYPGSPAASREEREAAGYPDVEVTFQDLIDLAADRLSSETTTTPTHEDDD